MSPEPFVSRAKALPAKRSEKGYGEENWQYLENPASLPVVPNVLHGMQRHPFSLSGEFAWDSLSLVIALCFKPPPLTRTARIGLGTRL